MSLTRSLLAIATILAAAVPALAAGNVEAEIDDKSTVRLTGDAEPNRIEVVPGEGQDVWLVVGTDGTTINGLPQIEVASARGLRAVLGDGDDRIEVRGIVLDRDLRLDLGTGDDRVVVSDVIVRGRTVWSGGSGDDYITIEDDCVLRRSVRLAGNRGADEMYVLDSRLLGPWRMRGNRGADRVIVRRCAFVENARVYVDMGNGEDDVTFDTCKLDRDVDITTGAARDYVLIVDCHANDDFDAHLGSSDDLLNIDDTTFNKDVDVDGDSGNDRLDFDGDVRFRGAEKHPDRYEVEFKDFERGD